MTQRSRLTETLVAEMRNAAAQAQGLLLAARAIEARVSALNADTPNVAIVETAQLIKASTLHMSALVLGLVAQGERLTLFGSEVPSGSDREDPNAGERDAEPQGQNAEMPM